MGRYSSSNSRLWEASSCLVAGGWGVDHCEGPELPHWDCPGEVVSGRPWNAPWPYEETGYSYANAWTIFNLQSLHFRKCKAKASRLSAKDATLFLCHIVCCTQEVKSFWHMIGRPAIVHLHLRAKVNFSTSAAAGNDLVLFFLVWISHIQAGTFKSRRTKGSTVPPWRIR